MLTYLILWILSMSWWGFPVIEASLLQILGRSYHLACDSTSFQRALGCVCGVAKMNLSKFSEMFDKKKTFRPKKKFQPGTMKYSLHKQAQASLNSGINLRQVSTSEENISISKSYIANNKLTQGGQTAKRRGFQRLAGCARGRLLQQVRLILPTLSQKV